MTLLESVKAALKGGADVIQLREKHLDGKQLVTVGREIKKLCEETGAQFAVNDRIDVALLCEADIVHLGQDDIQIEDAEKLVGNLMQIGISTHDAVESKQAEQAGAAYVGLGPVYSTKTKLDAKPIVPTLEIQNVRQAIHIPIVAIGGIRLSSVSDLIDLGVDAIAVVSGIFAAQDIERATRAFYEAIIQAKARRQDRMMTR
ncbi:thiamine-phosphate diphosphorylase [Sulfoacidibacillus thermotolerans]|uniref:Thiamine-phosphate synthase n=2 Tax=Sulfoacidibacillus thermotolerans TaxID=1765684 RepID=A0A2U3D5S1_SULT2|nr:thiamine-phosphate diphosphorylase [Sulfoacidibacillus thermotolerans]